HRRLLTLHLPCQGGQRPSPGTARRPCCRWQRLQGNRTLAFERRRGAPAARWRSARRVPQETSSRTDDSFLYPLGSYRIAPPPEPTPSRLTSFKSTRFDSPANNVGPCPASL